MMVYAYDMQGQYGIDLMRPVLELSVIQEGNPNSYLWYIDNLWDLYICAKFTTIDKNDKGKPFYRDGKPRSVYDLYT